MGGGGGGGVGVLQKNFFGPSGSVWSKNKGGEGQVPQGPPLNPLLFQNKLHSSADQIYSHF